MPNALPSLVADIGGTNTRVALADGMTLRLGSVRRFANAGEAGLGVILRRYLAEGGHGPVGGACIAVAGPVHDGVATMTNLDWVIDGDTLRGATGALNVAILNDLQAPAHALGHIAPERLTVLVPGEMSALGTKLVINVGTGFNAAPAHETPFGRVVPPSECGHINMPVRTEADLRLAQFVESAHGFPSVEDVLSGRGLERLYVFAAREAGMPAHATTAAIIAAMEDATDPLATSACRLMARLLGAEAGNLALIHLPFGGIYLFGGLARALASKLVAFGFAEAFRDKGRFGEFMDNFAISVIDDDHAALTGCAVFLDQSTPE